MHAGTIDSIGHLERPSKLLRSVMGTPALGWDVRGFEVLAFVCSIFIVSSLSSSLWNLVAGSVLTNALCSLAIWRAWMNSLCLLSFWIALCLHSLAAMSFFGNLNVARHRLEMVMPDEQLKMPFGEHHDYFSKTRRQIPTKGFRIAYRQHSRYGNLQGAVQCGSSQMCLGAHTRRAVHDVRTALKALTFTKHRQEQTTTRHSPTQCLSTDAFKPR